MTTPFNQTLAFPYYAEPTLYVAVGGMLRPWE